MYFSAWLLSNTQFDLVPLVIKCFQYCGVIYSIVLIVFRHSVFEDNGMIQSVFDFVPFIGYILLSFLGDQTVSALNLPPIVSQIGIVLLGIMSLYSSTQLHSKYVVGRIFKSKGVDLNKKVYIVTGSNTGIGFDTARELAAMNGIVVLACRSLDKAALAKQVIIKETNCSPSNIIVLKLDLCSFDSVRKFVKEFLAYKLPLHCLINNAGVMLATRELTQDGLETVITANHLSHFLLTNLLLPELEKTNGRVVVLTSSLHHMASSFNFDDIMSIKSFSLFTTYAQSKLANILFAYELQRRLIKKGSKITCNAVHPGCVATEVERNMGVIIDHLKQLVYPLLMLLRKTPLQGAYSSLYAATSIELQHIGGKYIFNSALMESSHCSKDLVQGEKLWQISEKLTGLSR